jgi:hypothetical protein
MGDTYRKGLAVPVQADGRGSLFVVEGEEYTKRIVMVMLADCASDNPFQRDLEGLGDTVIFALSTPMWKRYVASKVKDGFARLETDQLAKFSRLTWNTADQGDGSGVQEVEVEYINLETDQPDTVSTTFARSGA